MSCIIINNYISEQEAESVLSFLNKTMPPADGLSRTVKRYGITKSYAGFKQSAEIPQPLKYLCDKLLEDGHVEPIGHVTVNRYDVGQSIPWHIDSKEAGEVITIISLNADCNFLLKSEATKKITAYAVPKNSLLQLSGESRYRDKHSVEPVKALRYSIVFRKQ